MILLYKILKNTKSKFFYDNENTKPFFTMAKYSIGTHVEFFYSDIIENEFIVNGISDTDIENELNKYVDLYCYAKKTYNTLKNFVKRIRLKKFVKIYEMDTDLLFNKLSMFPVDQKIELLENNTLYVFRLSDLINIINDSLTLSDGLFPMPKKVKNPYTNLNFTECNLYNIYFALLESKFHIPILINLFFNCEFNLTIFINKFYPYLKDLSIMKYVKEGSPINKYEYLENLFFDFRKEINWVYIPRKESLRYSQIKL